MKSYKVVIYFGSEKTELVLGGANAAHAILIARKIYKNGRVVSAIPIK